MSWISVAIALVMYVMYFVEGTLNYLILGIGVSLLAAVADAKQDILKAAKEKHEAQRG